MVTFCMGAQHVNYEVLWTKALVPINALQRNAIKRFCSLARKILFNQDQMAITSGSKHM